MSTDLYFAPLLTWQHKAWQQLTGQFVSHHLPHGLLAAGMAGIGKRAFVWRLTAYLLCQNRNEQGACGACDSCHWLMAGTHPDLMVLPAASKLGADGGDDTIKIDDIRELQVYSQSKGHGAKVIVLDHADTLTIAAANALLKTLEEPRDGVFLILISDYPSRLLPTIKSRVQLLPLTQIDTAAANAYLDEQGVANAQMLLDIAEGAPLMAQMLADEAWFAERMTWLKTLIALQSGMRTPSQASSFWQEKLPLAQFIHLSRMMVLELWRYASGLPCLHTDLDLHALFQGGAINTAVLDHLSQTLDDVQSAISQNIQEKIAYDRLMVAMVG